MLENFPTYIMNRVNEMSQSHVMKELKSIQFVKPKSQSPFSSNIICFALLQSYASRDLFFLNLHLMEALFQFSSLVVKLVGNYFMMFMNVVRS